MTHERWSSRRAHDELNRRLDHVHELLHRIIEKVDETMTTAAEIKSALADALAEVRANTDAISAMKALLVAANEALTQLQAQIDALVADNANDVGADDVAEISATIAEIKKALDDQAAIVAVTANT